MFPKAIPGTAGPTSFLHPNVGNNIGTFSLLHVAVISLNNNQVIKYLAEVSKKNMVLNYKDVEF